jgi:hypothetical protein
VQRGKKLKLSSDGGDSYEYELKKRLLRRSLALGLSLESGGRFCGLARI